MTPPMNPPGDTVQEDNSEMSKRQQDLLTYTMLSSNRQGDFHAQGAIYPEIKTEPSPHGHIDLITECGLPVPPPHRGAYDIKKIISASNLSDQLHFEQTIAIVMPISGVSTVVAVKVYFPQCMMHSQPILPFWSAIQRLSELAYLKIYDDCTQVEAQELLAQLSFWAVTLLPVVSHRELESELKLLSFLGSRVLLAWGATGLLSGWSDHKWLISVDGEFLWVQSVDILGQTD